MTIQEMQEAIIAAGWQFIEHIFNDGKPNNCMIEFTNDLDCLAFMGPKNYDRFKYKGWGRFERRYAWLMAYDCIVVRGGKDEYSS